MNFKNSKILVTCGPTWVPIDAVRIISNTSSGELGQTIAQKLNQEGASVTLLEGQVTNPLKTKQITIKKFSFYEDLLRLMKEELKKNYAIVIHLAAVSDYKLKNPFTSKLSSHLKTLKIELVPTKKIINDIKILNPKIFLVGFKLLPKISKSIAIKAASDLTNKTKCDLVVVNSVANNKYSAFIVDRKRCSSLISSRNKLAENLINILKHNQDG